MRPLQMAFPMGNEPEPGPVLYLACPLTSVDEVTRQLVDSYCTHICTTVTETTRDSERPWEVAVHAPVFWSNPARGDDRTPGQIYQLNSQRVRDCAGLIVLSIHGGSTGIGQELAWAFALRLPVLFLHQVNELASRQIVGTPGDLTVAEFDDANDLIEAVRHFLRSQRAVIEDRERRAAGEAVKFASFRALLVEAWDSRDDARQEQVQAESRVHRRRIAELLESDYALGMASLSELTAFAGALDVPFDALAQPARFPDLGERELIALAQVCDEYEWTGSKALELEQAARMELARGGIRRLTLLSPEDWLRFDRNRTGHA